MERLGERLDALFDTHAHLDFPDFDPDRDEVLRRAREAGLRWLINPGADMDSSRRAVALAGEYAEVFAAVGVHPHDAATLTPAALEELRRLARQSKVVAIGEIGLDYYRDLSPRPAQREAFRRQLELAGELGLPVIIHDRDAHAEVLDILEDWRSAGAGCGVLFHAFSGDEAMARHILERGWYVAIGGPVTYRNARRLPALVPSLPPERIVVETDCPYLTPHPHRGRRNEPAYVHLVVEKLAELLCLTPAEVAVRTTQNALTFFALKGRMGKN